MSEHGFIDPLSLALIAFTIFVVVMAGGIAVDRVIHDAACDPAQAQCIDYGSGSVEAPK